MLVAPPEAGPFFILIMTSFGNEEIAVEAIESRQQERLRLRVNRLN